MYRLNPQLQPHLPPPGSSCRESSRPAPRRRRRGCSRSASAAWSAPRGRRPPSPAGPSWTKTRSSRGTRYEASWRLGRGDRRASRAAMVPRGPGKLAPASRSRSGPDVAFLAAGGLHFSGGGGGRRVRGGGPGGGERGKSEVSPGGSWGSRRRWLRLGLGALPSPGDAADAEVPANQQPQGEAARSAHLRFRTTATPGAPAVSASLPPAPTRMMNARGRSLSGCNRLGIADGYNLKFLVVTFPVLGLT